ncbi:hypothetical protein UFOVP1082_24 [uncultured Caudovirales phage]|uniref:Uncharacterized protein n=1 Tax=uncultured Caudovirales phage TaxID=2100421 RepID=A0A6J5RUG4_9CAUD|nr:hypothetical protein UFOVP906_2 [uncultured Caudovirales phage]CAB4176406.1 hypothetical protein UFOVP992_28 [uncultured Caudovirales phage]CAB4183235.1 hypothetical protein UFOVP1082_24 [uncultured Caudovirales phage]CAB4197228.1 hypothetical protein UFOVP1322_9 [uncultured Caudovirales phage]CAB4212612.1 hypothetical protein UFOVP1434_31 [uncultured Caudovirales phage]
MHAELFVEQVSDKQLSLVSLLVKELGEIDSMIVSVESELHNLNDRKKFIEQKRLPDAMSDVGFDELKLTDGSKITVRQEYYASITGVKKQHALAWLKENGFDDVIKTEVKVSFTRGQNVDAGVLFNEINEQYPSNKVEISENVHPSTLKSMVKEQFESGSPMPEDLFGIYIINRAILSK